MEKDRIKESITGILDKMGVPKNVKGFNYLAEAIQLAIDENKIKLLYSAIAEKYGTNTHCVKNSIAHAVRMTLKKGNKQTLEEIFGKSVNQVRTLEFIAIIANELTDQNLEEKYVIKAMKEEGIPMDISGHKYLKEAILMLYKNAELRYSMSKVIYPTIAKKYNTTSCGVHKAIRYIIEETWRIRSLLDSDYKRLTNAKFIRMVADNLNTYM